MSDQAKQGQAKPNQPATQQAQPAAPSTAAGASQTLDNSPAVIDPFNIDDPLACPRWLLSKGWKPLGNPRSDYTRWLAPWHSDKVKVSKRKVIAPHFNGYNEKKEMTFADKPVMVKNEFGQMVEAEQVVITPADREYTVSEAVRRQMERDQLEAEKTAKRELAVA